MQQQQQQWQQQQQQWQQQQQHAAHRQRQRQQPLAAVGTYPTFDDEVGGVAYGPSPTAAPPSNQGQGGGYNGQGGASYRPSPIGVHGYGTQSGTPTNIQSGTPTNTQSGTPTNNLSGTLTNTQSGTPSPRSRLGSSSHHLMDSTIGTVDTRWDQGTFTTNNAAVSMGGVSMAPTAAVAPSEPFPYRVAGVEREERRQECAEEYGPKPRHPPFRFSKRPGVATKLAAPIRNRPKVAPGRLFVRMPVPNDNLLAYQLGEYSVGFRFTPVESYLVEKARKKLERRAKKEAKRHGAPGQVFGPAEEGTMEARDDVETRAHNARAMKERQLMEQMEIPKLASLLVRHGSPKADAQSPTNASQADSRTNNQSDNAASPLAYNTVWSSAPGINFVGAASLTSIDIQTSGTMTEHFGMIYKIQTVDSIQRGPAHVITMCGRLGHTIIDGELPEDSPSYTLEFKLVNESTRALKFTLRVEGGRVAEGYDNTANSAHLFGRTSDEESFFGLGARFSKPSLKGLEVQVCHPSCDDAVAGGGNQHCYSPKNTTNSCTVPHFVSSAGVSLHLHNVEPTIFDFTSDAWYSIRAPCSVLSGTLLSGSSLLHALELHTGLRGRTRPLPKWTQRNGMLAGMQGGTDAVRNICRILFTHRCPLAGVLIRDWTGSKSSANFGGNSGWYNHVLEREHYTGWQALMDSLERRGVSVGLYLTPYLEEIPMHLRSGRRYLYGEAKADYFVKKRADAVAGAAKTSDGAEGPLNNDYEGGGRGESLAMYNHFRKDAKCGMLDPTNPSAISWFKQSVKEELLDYSTASFWLASLPGGGPPMDGIYAADSNDGLSFHNSYGERWAEANRDAIREAGRDGDGFFIADSAFGSAARHAGCTSLGADCVANFRRDDDDGSVLRSVLNGILNGGFSGLTHGHCAVSVAVPRRIQSSLTGTVDAGSREMLCRWFEMTAFTVLFRTHDGGAAADDRTTLCAYHDEKVMRSLALWSNVYVALAEYRLQLLNEASFRGYPVVRHPVLHFPNDERFNCCNGSDRKKTKKDKDGWSSSYSDSFMLGDLLYVAPVLKCGVRKKKVYLPEGGWIHLWTEEQVAGPHSIGKTVEVMAPLGEPPVFVRDVDTMHRFVEDLRHRHIIRRRDDSIGSSMGATSSGGKSSSSLFSSFQRK